MSNGRISTFKDLMDEAKKSEDQMREAFIQLIGRDRYQRLNGSASLVSPDGKTQIDFN